MFTDINNCVVCFQMILASMMAIMSLLGFYLPRIIYLISSLVLLVSMYFAIFVYDKPLMHHNLIE